MYVCEVCVCMRNESMMHHVCGGKFDQSQKARGNRDRNREPLTTATHSVFIRTCVFEHRLVSPIPLKIQHFHLAAAVTDNIQSYAINQFQLPCSQTSTASLDYSLHLCQKWKQSLSTSLMGQARASPTLVS